MDRKEIKYAMTNKKEIIVNCPTTYHEKYRLEKGIIVEERYNFFRENTYKILFKNYDIQKFNKIQMCEFYKEELELDEE